MSFKYLSLEEILRLHFQLIEDFGGSHGVRDEHRLKSVVEAPKQTVFSKEQYPSVCEKAAVYARNIVGDHPFNDGNKRTGITVCGIFLMRNNKKLTATPKDLEDLAVKIATNHLEVREIANWLEERTAERESANSL
jgi:death on curing protein